MNEINIKNRKLKLNSKIGKETGIECIVSKLRVN